MKPADDLIIIVPARAGSMRLPGKNKRDFNGKPLYVWTLDFIEECGFRSQTLVSTDDQEIANGAQDRGFAVPWVRPSEISGAQTSSSQVVEHAIRNSFRTFSEDAVLALLQVTTPIRQVSTFSELLTLARTPGEVGAVSVTQVPDGPFCVDSENRLWKRQDFPDTGGARLAPTGAFYFRRIQDFQLRQELIQGAQGVQEDKEVLAIDIDNQEQWDRAEFLVREHHLGT